MICKPFPQPLCITRNSLFLSFLICKMLIITELHSGLRCGHSPKFGSSVKSDDAKHTPRGYKRFVNHLIVFFCRGEQDGLP